MGERRGGWGIAVVATLGMSVSYVDRQTLAALAPVVTKALAIDNTHYGWLLSAFSFTYLVGAPIAGLVVDRFGARVGFAAAVVVWSIVAGAHALASSFAMLFALRILLGAAEAPSFPSAAQAIRRALPDARRPLAYGLLFSGSSLGAIVAAKLSVRLEAAYGFRGAFVGTALLGTLWIPVWLLVSRSLPPAEEGPLPRRPEGRRDASGGGSGGGSPVASAPGGPPRRIRRGSGGGSPVASAPGGAPRESWLSVVRSPAVVRAIVCIVGSAPAIMFVLNWTAKYLVDGWGVPKEAIGNWLLPAPLAFDLGAIGFGALAARRRVTGTTPRALLAIAMLLGSAIGFVPLAGSAGAAVALLAVAAAGGGGIYALVTADMLARVPVRRASAAGGMTAAAQSLAHVVAGPLVGYSVDRTHGYGFALVGLGAIVIPTTTAFLFWPGVESEAR